MSTILPTPPTHTHTPWYAGSCQSHDACPQADYCDEWGDCYACGGCTYYDDAFDGTCPDKCDVAPARVVVTSPTADSVLATGSYLPLQWSYNRAVEDRISFILLGRGSVDPVLDIAESTATAAKGLAWRIPRTLPAGYYWVAVVHPGSRSVIGMAPPALQVLGDVGFRVYSTSCASHDTCAGTEYCDAGGDCYDCRACLHERDAFDGMCPVKCGGGAVFQPGQRFPDEDEGEAVGPVVSYAVPGCGR